MGRALIVSWRESAIARGKRGTVGTGGTEGTGKDGDHVAQTGTERPKEASAAAENGEANAGRKKETEQKTGAGRKTGITIRTEAPRGKGPETGRTGQRMTNGGIKRIETDTGRTGKPKGRVGAEAEKGGIKAGRRRRAGKETAATAESGTESGTGSALTNAAAAKRGVAISESPATSTVNTENGKEVRARSKRSNPASTCVILSLLSAQLSGPSCAQSEGALADGVSVRGHLRPNVTLISICFQAFHFLLEYC